MYEFPHFNYSVKSQENNPMKQNLLGDQKVIDFQLSKHN